MTWCNDSDEERGIDHELVIAPTITITPSPSTTNNNNVNTLVTHDHTKLSTEFRTITCPSCGHNIEFQDQSGINDLPGLPAGVKFDPNDQEILEHLEAKVLSDMPKLHPLIDEFIPTLQGENGICYTHPEKLPGVSKDGQIRHFFHRPSKAYTTGTRKRRKVHTDEEGSETRWHKTGKTRPVFVGGFVKGFKKILVLYTNYGRQKKPEKTNWVMHQYHLGTTEEEKDGELVVSKVFYQTQPRQCGNNNNNNSIIKQHDLYDDQDQRLMINDDNINIAPRNINAAAATTTTSLMDYYNNPSFINYDHQLGGRDSVNRETSPPQLIPNLVMQGDHSSSFFRLAMDATTNKTRLDRK